MHVVDTFEQHLMRKCEHAFSYAFPIRIYFSQNIHVTLRGDHVSQGTEACDSPKCWHGMPGHFVIPFEPMWEFGPA